MTGQAALLAVLAEAQILGFLGPGDVGEHVRHAAVFGAAFPPNAKTGLDLGSGAGVPGLVLALAQPAVQWTLIDAAERRVAFLEHAVATLDLAERVVVRRGRAEELGRDTALRGAFDVVAARAFGAPPVTAECGAPFLGVGGVLLVSEPPHTNARRWPTGGLALLGLRDEGLVVEGFSRVRVIRLVEPLSDRYPRGVGVPSRRPMFPVKRSILDPSALQRQDEAGE